MGRRSICVSLTGVGESRRLFRPGFPSFRLCFGSLFRNLQGRYGCVTVQKLDTLTSTDRWLIANGKKNEAEELLARFHTAGDASHPLIQFEMAEIAHTIEMESQASETRWTTLVKTPGNRHRTFIAVCVGAFAQWNVCFTSHHFNGSRETNQMSRASLSYLTISRLYSTMSASKIQTHRL